MGRQCSLIKITSKLDDLSLINLQGINICPKGSFVILKLFPIK